MIQGKSFSGPDLGIYQSDIFGLEKDKRKLSVIRALRSDGGLEANIDTLNLEPLDLMKIRHPQLMEIQDDYSGNKELGSYDIPTPYEFGEVRNTVEELENLGLAETQIVEDKSAEIKLDTHDPVEYRQVMNVLSEIEGLEFDRKHHVKSRRKTATDLDYVRARISIKEEHEDGLPEEYEEDLSQFLNELEDQRLIRTNEEKAHNPP